MITLPSCENILLKMPIKNISQESALCQPLCSLTFEMRRGKREKNQTRAWGGHWSLRPVLRGATSPSFGKEAEMCAWLLGPLGSLTKRVHQAWIESDIGKHKYGSTPSPLS